MKGVNGLYGLGLWLVLILASVSFSASAGGRNFVGYKVWSSSTAPDMPALSEGAMLYDEYWMILMDKWLSVFFQCHDAEIWSLCDGWKL